MEGLRKKWHWNSQTALPPLGPAEQAEVLTCVATVAINCKMGRNRTIFLIYVVMVALHPGFVGHCPNGQGYGLEELWQYIVSIRGHAELTKDHNFADPRALMGGWPKR